MTVTARTWPALGQALREITSGAIGAVRTIAADKFLLGLPRGEAVKTSSHRAIEKTLIEIEIGGINRLDYASGYCNRSPARARITIRLAHTADHRVLAERRHEVSEQALEDHETIYDALTFPNNLLTTADGTATGVSSGALKEIEAAALTPAWKDKVLFSTRVYEALMTRHPAI